MGRFLITGLLVVATYALDARAAGIGLGSLEADGDFWVVPVGLLAGNGETVASLQFDLYAGNGAVLVEVLSGDAAQAAGKDVIFAQRGESTAVIVAGLNQTAIPSGVVAWAVFAKKPKPRPEIANVILADPHGQAVDLDEVEEEGSSGAPVPEVDPPVSDDEKATESVSAGAAATQLDGATDSERGTNGVIGSGAFPGSASRNASGMGATNRAGSRQSQATPANRATNSGGGGGGSGFYQSGGIAGGRATTTRTTVTSTRPSVSVPPTPAGTASNVARADSPSGNTAMNSAPNVNDAGSMEAFKIAQSSGSAVPQGGHRLGARATQGKALLPKSDAPTSRRTGFGILLLVIVPILFFAHRVVYGKRKKRF